MRESLVHKRNMKLNSCIHEVSITKNVKCRFIWDGRSLTCQWSPRIPKRFTRPMLKRFGEAKQEFADALAQTAGKDVVIVDREACKYTRNTGND